MKNFLYLICLVLVPGLLSAQKSSFSIGANLAFPSGNLSNSAGTGFGGSLRYEQNIKDNAFGMLTLNYLTFGSQSYTILSNNYTSKVSMIPLLAGVKYYLGESPKGWFAGLELGVNFLHLEVSNNSITDTTNESDFCYGLGAGYRLQKLELGTSFQVTNSSQNLNLWNFRVAYVLN